MDRTHKEPYRFLTPEFRFGIRKIYDFSFSCTVSATARGPSRIAPQEYAVLFAHFARSRGRFYVFFLVFEAEAGLFSEEDKLKAQEQEEKPRRCN